MIPTLNNQITMTSLEISELVNSRHDKVKQSIDRLSSDNDHRKAIIQQPPMGEVKNHLGQSVSVYLINKRDSYIIVAQLSPEFTARLVDRWQELEQQSQFKLPQTFSEALKLAAIQAEQLEAAKPAIEFVERYVESTGNKGFREVCKLINANETKFRDFLLNEKIMYRLGGAWTAYQNHIDAGRFTVKAGIAQHSEHSYTSAKFTPKGLAWIAMLWNKEAG